VAGALYYQGYSLISLSWRLCFLPFQDSFVSPTLYIMCTYPHLAVAKLRGRGSASENVCATKGWRPIIVYLADYPLELGYSRLPHEPIAQVGTMEIIHSCSEQ
jgi:hypothetical protein